MHFITSSTDLYIKIDDNTIKTIIKTISVLFSCNLLKTVFVINIIKTKIYITDSIIYPFTLFPNLKDFRGIIIF